MQSIEPEGETVTPPEQIILRHHRVDLPTGHHRSPFIGRDFKEFISSVASKMWFITNPHACDEYVLYANGVIRVSSTNNTVYFGDPLPETIEQYCRAAPELRKKQERLTREEEFMLATANEQVLRRHLLAGVMPELNNNTIATFYFNQTP